MLIKIKKKQLDRVVRLNFEQTELKRRYYKFMKLQSRYLNNMYSYLKYKKMLSQLPKVKYHNFCYLTGRGKGVFRAFRLSRHQIRDKFKYLHGLTNSSW